MTKDSKAGLRQWNNSGTYKAMSLKAEERVVVVNRATGEKIDVTEQVVPGVTTVEELVAQALKKPEARS